MVQRKNDDEHRLAHYIPPEHLTFTGLHHAALLDSHRRAAELR